VRCMHACRVPRNGCACHATVVPVVPVKPVAVNYVRGSGVVWWRPVVPAAAIMSVVPTMFASASPAVAAAGGG
jgi:hypothetical protein